MMHLVRKVSLTHLLMRLANKKVLNQHLLLPLPLLLHLQTQVLYLPNGENLRMTESKVRNFSHVVIEINFVSFD